jgi:hypothetical protein
MLYQGECASLQCGQFEELLSLREYEEKGLTCPTCAGSARTVIQAVPTVGAMPSRPIEMNQIGQSFTSNSEMRRYFAKHPGRHVVDKDSAEWRTMYDDTRNGADAAARAKGYKDVRHEQQSVKRERDRKRTLDAGVDTPKLVK